MPLELAHFSRREDHQNAKSALRFAQLALVTRLLCMTSMAIHEGILSNLASLVTIVDEKSVYKRCEPSAE